MNSLNVFKLKNGKTKLSFLPDYGGKGMYGDKVHEAVLKNKER